MNTKARLGFTIMEVATVIFIIGLLATVGYASYVAVLNRAALKTAETDLRQAAAQVEKFKSNNGSYPAGESQLGDNGFRRTENDRTYTYVAVNGMYCIETKVSRSDKYLHIKSGGSTVHEGHCQP